MPSKRKWWSENWQSTLSMTVILIFTMGVLHTQLQAKIDYQQAEIMIDKGIVRQAYPLIEGVRLQSEYKYIKEDLDDIKKELATIKEKIFTIAKNTEINQSSRTTANKKNEFVIPRMSITDLPGLGIQDRIPIKELNSYELTH